nr:hypothetical protein [Microvirga calopogonii]
MPVIPTFLAVAHTAAVRFGEAKFQFVEMKEALHHSRRIRTAGRWIDVDVMDWAIRPPVCCGRDQFTELSTEIGGGQAPGFHELHRLPSFPGQEVTGERRPPLTSGGARDHARPS